MAVMTTLPHGRPLTRADLDEMPADGHRYELIDGMLIVSPSPSWHHQRAAKRLLLLLEAACPPHLEVLPGPFDVALAEDTVIIPDVIVARRGDLTERDLPAAPVLAVEVLSPSTRRMDLTLKRSRLEAAGADAYWVVDPLEPSVTAWQLVDGAFVETGHATGSEALTLTRPVAVRIVPAELVAD
jgi:Uma2 family endonuclease